MDDIASTIKTRRQASEDYLVQKRILWDNAEKLFHNQLNDSISFESNSQVFDPKLSTLTIERGYRVMAQLATGKVKAMSSNDIGDVKLKNLLLDKYVIPNAKSQFDFLTKCRMVDIYSNVYGNFFVLVDHDVREDGYIGPDMWLLNIRDVFPQPGAVSVEDSDYIIIRTWRPYSFFEGLSKNKDYKNIPAILTKLKDQTGSKQNRDSTSTSKREEDQYPNKTASKNKGYFEVLTMYEKDTWTDYCVDADSVFRQIDNPHDNHELPVVCKYSIPLLDDFMGMGDFERGGTMQMVINSIWNLYLEACRISIMPPVLINKDNIASLSSFKPLPGAQWLGRNQVNNIAQPLNLSPQGIAQFNNTYQVATAAILNLYGTSETNTSAQTDPQFGKTPQALKMQSQRENTRDNADRFYMEQFVTNVMRKMVNLLNKKQSGALTFRMFPDEIDRIAREYPEVKDLYDGKTGKLTVKKGKSSMLYDYEIVSGSTYAADQDQQQQNLQMILDLWMKSQTPQGNFLEAQLKQNGYNLNFGELFKRIISQSGIQDWDKILEEMTKQEQAKMITDQHMQQFQQMIAQAPAGMPGTPPQPPGMQQPPQGMPIQPVQPQPSLSPQGIVGGGGFQ